MTKSRAEHRKRIKALRKELKKRMTKVKESLGNIPKTCKTCDEKFVKDRKRCLDWKISVSATSGITVTCPSCVKKLEGSIDKND